MTYRRIAELLHRADKWYLGGGNRLLWAPPFPLHLDAPGLWDKAHYFNAEVEPLFTWSLLDENGMEIPLASRGREWTPDRLRQQFAANDSRITLRATEEKTILPNDTAVCHITLATSAREPITVHLVGWTVQEHSPSQGTTWLDQIHARHGVIGFTKKIRAGSGPHMDCAIAFGLSGRTASYAIQLSEGRVLQPSWALTPFAEMFRSGRLPSTSRVAGVTPEGLIFMAVHRVLTVKRSAPGTVTIALAASHDPELSGRNLRQILTLDRPVDISAMSWNEYFNSVPDFRCSDKTLTNYYWYRWYGLRLNTVRANEGNYSQPFVCEGIGYFRAPISYSAPCHILENRWRHSPELAQGSLRVFLDNQRPDGGFRGYIDVHHYRQEMFYHAGWGRAVRQLLLMHPSAEFQSEAYEGLSRYARYFDSERDEEVSGLYDIDNHYETGQEYMHRYLAVNPNADRDNWGEVFRLKGVDVSVYLYDLKRTLGSLAAAMGKSDDADLWTLEADRTKAAILSSMWDPEEEMFFDVNPVTGQRTGVKAAVCFYPYFTDIVSREHLRGLKRHLLNRREFWTPYPVPSSSADDEFYSATPDWKGKRMNCPWNGRVWPMTNSHISEVLAASALRFNDRRLRRATADFVRRFIGMMFFDGDPRRPNCFEHYNPLTGQPSLYRGIDDYQHSWVADLILSYVCGIRPDASGVIIDPFPFGLPRVSVDRVLVRGHVIRVDIRGSSFSVRVDGKLIGEETIGTPVTVAWSE